MTETTNEPTEVEETKSEIVEYNATEAALATLREKYGKVQFDVETTKGLAAAKEARAEVKGFRVDLEKMRKDLKAPITKKGKLIDAEAKRITAELVELEEPIDEQIKAEEARKEKIRQEKIRAEQERIEGIQGRIDGMRDLVQVAMSPNNASADIQNLIDKLKAIEIDDSYDEFVQTAEDARAATVGRLRELFAAAVEREEEAERIAKERAELEELRALQEKRDAEEKAKREAEEAERQKKQAEEDAIREAAAQKQRDELEAQRKEQEEKQRQLDAEQAEIDRQKEEALRKEQEERDRKQQLKDEQERKAQEAADAAKRAKFPGTEAITEALCQHFNVPVKVVQGWFQLMWENEPEGE